MKEIGEFHDDRRSDLRRFDELEMLATDAERRLARLRSYDRLKIGETPWREFVRKVARCFHRIGITPTATGRVYRSSWGTKPTWFQKFMVELNENLLGEQGKGKQLRYSRAAFYAEIVKALGGNVKPGKARK